MLISFKVANFMSFNEEVELSMVAGLTRSLPHHVIKTKGKNDLNILKTAIIYGANASGKSNLIRAMDFGRKLITKGTKPQKNIPIKYFKLQDGNEDKLSDFQYDLKYKDRIYSYRFSINSNIVKYETLQEIKKNREIFLFSRQTTDNDSVKISFSRTNKFKKKEQNFLNFIAKGTRPNQLFLTESIERNVKHYKDVYEWFEKRLNIIFPSSHIRGLEYNIDVEQKEIKNYLLQQFQQFDSSISDICTVEIPLFKLDMPEDFRKKVEKDIQKEKVVFIKSPDGQRYSINLNKKNELVARKLCTVHNMKNLKKKVIFDLNEESDGTQRMFDLIPALITFSGEEDIFVIDEIDRSLHPHITRNLIEVFLNKSKINNNQLIVTTHESSLLDLNLVRKDEIWFIEKKDGQSKVFSLEEFKPRYDKDIRKGYLLGRFGAIPIIKKTNSYNKKEK